MQFYSVLSLRNFASKNTFVLNLPVYACTSALTNGAYFVSGFERATGCCSAGRKRFRVLLPHSARARHRLDLRGLAYLD